MWIQLHLDESTGLTIYASSYTMFSMHLMCLCVVSKITCVTLIEFMRFFLNIIHSITFSLLRLWFLDYLIGHFTKANCLKVRYCSGSWNLWIDKVVVHIYHVLYAFNVFVRNF